MTSYHGRTVLVTGASGGIGEAMARRLARDGARLLLTARSEQLADEFRSFGAETHVFAHDLASPAGPRRSTPALPRPATRWTY